jgi:O-antigen/teichoic acid export membrane protein
MQSLRKIALTGSTWTSLSKGCSILFYFLRLSVLSRFLDPDDFGLIAIVMIFATFCQVFSDMGISAAIVHRHDANRDELSSLYWLNIFSGFTVFLIFITSVPITSLFFEDSRLSHLLFLISPIFIITSFGQQFKFILQREFHFRTLSLIDFFAVVFNTFFTIVMVFSGYGVFSIILGTLSESIIRSFLLCYIGFHKWKPKFRFYFEEVRNFLKFGVFQMGDRGLNYIGWQIDKLIMGRILGPSALGTYNIAYTLAIYPLQAISPIINQVVFPIFSQIQFENDKLEKGYAEVISIISIVMMPLYVGMFVVSEPLILVFFGDKWIEAIPFLKLLSILGIFYSIGNPISNLLLSKGRSDIGFYLNCIVFILYSISVFIGSFYGVNYIILSMIIVHIFFLFPLEYIVRLKLVNMSFISYYNAFSPYLISSIIMGIIVSLLRQYLMSFDPVVELFLSTIAGASVYLIIILFWQKSFLLHLVSIIKTKESP